MVARDNSETLVSVIVPNYNHAEYLPSRLQTVLEQTHSNLEIILLDDASTDNSGAILRKFAANCKKVSSLIINKHNSGLPIQQWLKGVSMARGDYIWVAESDDEATPDFISTLLKLLEKNPTAGFAYSDSIVINENGDAVSKYDYSFEKITNNDLWLSDFYANGGQFVKNYMVNRNVIPNVSAVLFRTSVIKKNLASSTFKFCADWELYIRILMENDIVFSSLPMNRFRRHRQTTRWHNTTSYAQEIKEKLALLRLLKAEYGNDEKVVAKINSSLQFIFYNRHKHKNISRLAKSLESFIHTNSPQIYLFGANDIAEQLVDVTRRMKSVPIIIDNQKNGQSLQGLVIISLDDLSLDSACIVVICSLKHQQEMEKQLQRRGFTGRVLKV